MALNLRKARLPRTRQIVTSSADVVLVIDLGTLLVFCDVTAGLFELVVDVAW
jgi:hypothetical protein